MEWEVLQNLCSCLGLELLHCLYNLLNETDAKDESDYRQPLFQTALQLNHINMVVVCRENLGTECSIREDVAGSFLNGHVVAIGTSNCPTFWLNLVHELALKWMTN